MFSKLKYDLPASIVVFLVALPLCLGIALASGAPLISGLITGIIGGVVVGILSDSHVSVSGPAAGLAAVVLASITQLGDFQIFLLAMVLAGLLQLIAGFAKLGFLANYIPSNVIKGLLAAIGIILVLKQFPHALGYDVVPQEDMSFQQSDGENTFSELVNVFAYISWGAVIISGISMLCMLYWDRTPLKKIRFLPASLFVVVLGVVVNLLFGKFYPALALQSDHLVNIPQFEGFHSILQMPDFSSIGNIDVWTVALTIALVASIETLLNLEATEKLDPHKRQANSNRELVAQGVGNTLSGLVGGIPMTSVIIRSSVNINSGAATKLSAIIHGFFLLLSILLIAPVINLIPLASLAAILILTGYKLANLGLFRKMYAKGMAQFVPFIVTILGIVFTDLLIGVVIGLLVSIFYILKSNFRNPFTIQTDVLHYNETLRLELPNQASFLTKASIKEILWGVPAGRKVIIDASNADFVDDDIIEDIEEFRQTISPEKDIKLNVIGLKGKYELKNHVQFVNVLDKEAQQKLSPDEVLDILKKGNDRFVSGDVGEKYLKHQVNATSFGQNPFAIVLSCIDSRTTSEHVFDLGLGDIFSVRIAGNILNTDILGSMEFGVIKIGVKLVLVLGHTKCGAIAGACSGVKLGNLTGLLEKIEPAMAMEQSVTEGRDGTNPAFVDKVALENVRHTMERIRKESPLIAESEREGKIKIVGGMYSVENGKVTFIA